MSDVEYLPLTGDSPGLRTLADRASRAASALDDAHAAVRRVSGGLEGQRSDAVSGARHRLAQVLERLTACAGGLGSAATAFGGHAEVLEREQAAAGHAVARRDDALARVRQHETLLGAGGSFTWNVTPGLGDAWPAATQGDLLAARADAVAAEAQWRAARDAKHASALRTAAVLGGLAEVRAVRAAALAGTSTADYRASWLEGRRVAALLGPAGGGGRDDERRLLRGELREVLVAHADDAVFWPSFWDTATPGDVYRALGPNYRDPTPPPDDDLRAALAHGVADWARTATPAERTAFGAAVVDGVGRWSGFEARAGIAAAMLPPTLPAGVHGGAYDALVARWDEAGGDLFGRAGTAVVGTAVAAGLARHPRLAFDKLAPADDGRLARHSRAWFGWAAPALWTPRPGWPDGGEAVARLFRTAVREGSDSPRRADQARAAQLVAHATRDMRGGLLATPVSDRAGQDIATAYEPYVPSFAEAAEDQQPGVTDDVLLAEKSDERPRTVVQPELDAFALGDVITATSHGPQGADAWLDGAVRLRDDVIERAVSGAYDGSYTSVRDNLGDRYLHDVGEIAGAMEADTVSTARERMERRDAVVDLIGYGTAPLHPAASTGITFAAGTVAETMPDHVEIARAEVLASEAEVRRQFADPVYEAVVEHDMTLINSDTGEPYTRDEAELRAVNLDPDSQSACALFGESYASSSGAGRKPGEVSCES
ncbi:hypothetical protein [Isoptericola sp. BMS4]|uniref:hypothetical protein n=1 Tax=Isoptericola sp. BMS4 TaxID=2527875 RepID=UPI00142315E5|nr:hypothetical protein [Isoptericola sp. BMS4]